MQEKKNLLKSWKLWIGIILILAVLVICYIFYNKDKKFNEVNSNNAIQYKLGDMIVLGEEDKQILRNKTIEYVKDNLKVPGTAEFEEVFEYVCDEENIVKVKGYVDSQNGFGAMIRGNFYAEYFAIDGILDTLVYLKYDDKELLDIKETYIKEYKKQKELNGTKSSGNALDQEKLNYIMNEFNSEEWNGTAEITKVFFDDNESSVIVKLITENSKRSKQDEEYWTNFNICSILNYFNEFDINCIVKMEIYNTDNKKIVEINFDDDFIKNKWKENHQINLVKKLFGENYKESLN